MYLIESLSTGRALVRGVLHVQDLMDGQGSGLTKSFATFETFERFVFGMDVFVIPQVILSSERFATDITVKGSLIGVGPLVDQKVVRFGKFSLAKLTDVTFLWLGRGDSGPTSLFSSLCLFRSALVSPHTK